MARLLGLFLRTASVLYIYHQDRQPVLEAQKHCGPAAGLQFIDWVSVDDI